MGDERGPWIGSSWMVTAMPADDGPRPRVLLTWIVGVAVLLGALGAAGPHPVTAALPLPPADTSELGATGALPGVGTGAEVAPPTAVGPLPSSPPSAPLTSSDPGAGVPETMLAAYRGAASSMAAAAPGCHLPWALVAGIGKVESGHADGGAVTADGTTVRPVLGPELNGTGGNAAIADTDGGALDHDTVWDRAVGPTQFIPSSWRTYGADGNGDGVADPDNAFDAALATGRYLCAGGTDLATASGRHDAVFRYNHSESYVATVLRWADAYASGALPVPDSDGGDPDPVLASGTPTLAALPAPVSSFPTTGGAAAQAASASPGGAPAGAAPVGGSPVPVNAPSSPASVPSSPVVPAAPDTSSSTPRTAIGTGSSAAPPSSPPSAPPSPSLPASTVATAPSSTTTTPPASTTTTTPPAPSTATPPSSTTTTPRTTAVPVAQRCTASLPAVAKAFGVPAAELTAATGVGPKAGQLTCTVSRSGKPLVVAVAATTAPAPAVGAGVTRTVPGGRVVLSVPPSAGVPAATATAALTALAAAWS